MEWQKEEEEHRIAKELNTVDAWSKDEDIDNKIRKIVRKRKEEQYEKYVETWKKKTLPRLSHSLPK